MKYWVQRYIATKGFVSDAIKHVEGISYIDHVECLNRAGDKWIGAHAGTGVEARPLDWAKDVVWERRYALPLFDWQYEAIQKFLEASVGRPYDYTGILGILLHARKLDDPCRVMCSALQYEAACKGQVNMLNVLPEFAHLVTPETLHLSPKLVGNQIPDAKWGDFLEKIRKT